MKKGMGFAVTLVAIACLSAFDPPGKDGRKMAVGSLLHLTPDLRAAFSPDDGAFQPIPRPGPGDWLSGREEPGQTYSQFLASRPNRVGARGRKFIYLQPIGRFAENAPRMDTLQEYLAAHFHPVPVKLLKPLELKPSPQIKTRGDQVNSTDLLNVLQNRVPADACVLMAVTMKDLYPGPGWNFVFGVARLNRRCGVFSFARYGIEEDPKRALFRALKVISHETGHAFGIKHCVHFHCLMNGSNSLGETDRAPLHFCPACLRKLHWSLGFSPLDRYRKLAAFLKKEGLVEEAAWFDQRVRVLEIIEKK